MKCKRIKSESVQVISGNAIPYKNKWGNWVWRANESILEDKSWTGLRAPLWADRPEYVDGLWCWVSKDWKP